ncbi:DNA mismatch repair protein MLH1 [Enteropsectra breve]|nr:DNA mismatch repair protein MLH1 [Enteropsectra breve]
MSKQKPMIKKLPDTIISQISAGEVIISPYNIIKELLENSIDAGSTSIHVELSAELGEISVCDNGSGIDKEDYESLCLEHYTSKITSFEDLKRCGRYKGSFGFRGEALHSVSIVSHLIVESKTKLAETGYMAEYAASSLTALKKIAFEGHGTRITARDIFFNNTIRKEYFYKNKHEYMRCVELVKVYAAIWSSIELSVSGKKIICRAARTRNVTDLYSRLHIQPMHLKDHAKQEIINSAVLENKKDFIIATFIGEENRQNLETLVTEHGLMFFSNRLLYFKKYKFILFVNNRLVENESFKRQAMHKFRHLLKAKQHPFIYIELFASFADVNVHPGKAEVYIDDSSIYDKILLELDVRLQGKEDAASMLTQNTRPFSTNICSSMAAENANSEFEDGIVSNFILDGALLPEAENSSLKNEFLQQYQKESDLENSNNAKSGKLAYDDECAYNTKPAAKEVLTFGIEAQSKKFRVIGENETGLQREINEDASRSLQRTFVQSRLQNEMKIYTDPKQETLHDTYVVGSALSRKRIFSLLSLQTLISEIIDVDSEFFKNLVYVGIYGSKIIAQSHMNLISIDTKTFLKEGFYQKILHCFGNLKSSPVDAIQTELHTNLHEMLKEYFGLCIENGKIVQAPVIYERTSIRWDAFALDFSGEYETLKRTAEGIAEIYSTETIDGKLFNSIKTDVVGTEKLLRSCSLISNLKSLYKKFGRC